MRSCILLMGFLFSLGAYAETAALFPGQDAVVLIQGPNADALALYDAMDVEPAESSGYFKKEIEYSLMAKQVFALSCQKSKTAEVVSCTLKVFSGNGAIVDKNLKTFLVGVNDQWAAPSLGRKFKHAEGRYRGEVFISLDQKLHFYKTFDVRGDVVSFTIDYN